MGDEAPGASDVGDEGDVGDEAVGLRDRVD